MLPFTFVPLITVFEEIQLKYKGVDLKFKETMGYTAYRAITVTVLAQLVTVLCLVKGIPRFTHEPPSVLYVSSGGTARLVFDYNTKNRSELFDPYSPEWALFNSSGGRLLIGLEDGCNGWIFTIYKDCPTRLRDRVSKESTATLVISNVTTADSGMYECSLVLLSGSPIRSKVQLIVTDRPRFTTPVNLTTVVSEGSNLSIQCSATGSPMPNVTWVRILRRPRFISEGLGEAFLRFDNITRQQSGNYECQATNNPNEDPVTLRNEISAVTTPVEPANLSVPDINVTSALIKWLAPRDDGGSPIIEYKIQINTIPPRERIIKTAYHIFKNLNENTTYLVQVYARNEVGYGKAKSAEFTTKGRQITAVKGMQVNKETNILVTVHKTRIFAGVIGVIIWIVLISFAVLLVFIKKRCAEKGKDEEKVRRKPDIDSPDMSKVHEMVNYADISKKEEDQALPVYAQVDKKKKRRPGEILYAELEELKANEVVPNVASIPPKYHDTPYADIRH